MGFEEFVKRNKGPIVQILIAGLLIVGAIALFEMNKPKLDETSYRGVLNNATQTATPQYTGTAGTCTPLFNSSKRATYGYSVYSITSEGALRINVTYDYVGEESVAGIPAEITETRTYSVLNNLTFNPVFRTWLEKGTGRCLRAIMQVEDQVASVACSDASMGMPLIACEEQLAMLNSSGTDYMVVPAGNFTAKRYSGSRNETIWIADGIPMPVKFSFKSNGAESATGELLYYERK